MALSESATADDERRKTEIPQAMAPQRQNRRRLSQWEKHDGLELPAEL